MKKTKRYFAKTFYRVFFSGSLRKQWSRGKTRGHTCIMYSHVHVDDLLKTISYQLSYSAKCTCYLNSHLYWPFCIFIPAYFVRCLVTRCIHVQRDNSRGKGKGGGGSLRATIDKTCCNCAAPGETRRLSLTNIAGDAPRCLSFFIHLTDLTPSRYVPLPPTFLSTLLSIVFTVWPCFPYRMRLLREVWLWRESYGLCDGVSHYFRRYRHNHRLWFSTVFSRSIRSSAKSELAGL